MEGDSLYYKQHIVTQAKLIFKLKHLYISQLYSCLILLSNINFKLKFFLYNPVHDIVKGKPGPPVSCHCKTEPCELYGYIVSKDI